MAEELLSGGVGADGLIWKEGRSGCRRRACIVGLRLIVFLLIMAGHMTACSMWFRSVTAGPNFQVKVADRGYPVSGLRVEILNDRDNSRIGANTNKNGLAFFHNVQPGSYFLGIDHDDGGSTGVGVEVKPGGPAGVTVRLKWPNIAPIRVRSLKGTLRGPDYFLKKPQPGVALDLLEGLSGRVLKSVKLTDSGEFLFEGYAPGLYFLKLTPSATRDRWAEETPGLIAVTLNAGAPTAYLDIDFGWTSCGLWYGDQNQCPRPDLHLRSLSGQIQDETGAPIASGTILLFDHEHKLVDRLESGDSGSFASTHAWAGAYDLVVTSPGFTPFRKAVDIRPQDDSTAASSFVVHLGFGGSCSTATTGSGVKSATKRGKR